MHVVIFEGSRWPTFAPLSLTRPVFCLASGTSNLLTKQLRYFKPTRLTLWVRPGMVEYCKRVLLPTLKVPTAVNAPLDDEPALLVSGRTIHFGRYDPPTEPGVMMDNEGVCSAYVRSPGLSPTDVMTRSDAWMKLFELPPLPQQGRMASYLWDLIGWNEESIVDDAMYLKSQCDQPAKPAGPYHMINDEDVCLGRNVTLGPGCVLDASKGVIIVDDHAVIGPNAVIEGPCYIGAHSKVSPLAQIHAGLSVGPICKVGGEVGKSILMSYVNKPHDGYLGDSFIGEWVNFGAGTTTSNLKNTYGEIDVHVGVNRIATGRRFLGSMVGDHTKFAIGTRLMTGSYVGVGCMVAVSGLPPTTIPSFTFLTDKGATRYDTKKLREVINNTYRRRAREWQPWDDDVLSYATSAAAEVEGKG